MLGHVIVLLALVLSPTLVQALNITTCGQVVPAGDVGVVLADLVCPVVSSSTCSIGGAPCSHSSDCAEGLCSGTAAVTLETGARLQMNGHTIRGGGSGVECVGANCEIDGGAPEGVLESDGALCSGGVWAQGAKIELRNVRVVGGGCATVYNVGGKIVATNLTVENGTWGIQTSSLRGSNIAANNNAVYGMYITNKIKVNGLTANGNGYSGIVGSKLLGSNVTANNNGGDGLGVPKLKATNVEASNNAHSGVVSFKTSKVSGLIALNNGGPGYVSVEGGLIINGGTVTGNAVSDISTIRRARGSVICGTSSDQAGGDWDLCTLD